MRTMSAFEEYIAEIEERKAQGLHPKPIDDSALLSEIIAQIKDVDHAHREDSLPTHLIQRRAYTISCPRTGPSG